MKKICRCRQHDKVMRHTPSMLDGSDCIYDSPVMANARYINVDGSIDPDAYASACTDAFHEHRESNGIELIRRRKKKS